MNNYYDLSMSKYFIFAVLYEIFKPKHNAMTVMLPVNCSVQDIMDALVHPGEDHVLVKINSSGGMSLNI